MTDQGVQGLGPWPRVGQEFDHGVKGSVPLKLASVFALEQLAKLPPILCPQCAMRSGGNGEVASRSSRDRRPRLILDESK